MMGGSGPRVERITIFFVYHLVGLFVWWFTRLRVRGEENIPPGGPVLFLANHISALDVFVLPWSIYRKYPQAVLRQVSKEELLRIPVIGWILAKIRAVPIRRGKADLSAIRAIEGFIRQDMMIIYPEGTRSRDGKPGPGNRMVGRFIRNARPTVIPVGIKGTDRVVPVGKLLPRRGADVEIVFGAPLDLSVEYDIENAKESCVRIVERVMTAISSLIEGGEEEKSPAPVRAAENAGS